MIDTADNLIREINKRADDFVKDNFVAPTEHDVLFVRSAMMIGALVAQELELAEKRSENE